MTNVQYVGIYIRYPGSPFLRNPDRSFRRRLFAFWFAYNQPWENVVYGTNKTMRFLSKPLSPSGVKGRWHMQMVFVSAPLSDLGPFLPHLPPGPVQYNLIRWSFTEYCYMPGTVLTLEVQGEISCLAQETPSLPTHSHLTWYLHLSSYVKAPGESEGRSYSMNSHPSFGDLGRVPCPPRPWVSPL